MVKNCAKCGKELGLFANKHKTESNYVICDSCFKEWK